MAIEIQPKARKAGQPSGRFSLQAQSFGDFLVSYLFTVCSTIDRSPADINGERTAIAFYILVT